MAKVLERAAEFARRHDNTKVGTPHVLLALLDEDARGFSGQIFDGLGVTVTLRARLDEILAAPIGRVRDGRLYVGEKEIGRVVEREDGTVVVTDLEGNEL